MFSYLLSKSLASQNNANYLKNGYFNNYIPKPAWQTFCSLNAKLMIFPFIYDFYAPKYLCEE